MSQPPLIWIVVLNWNGLADTLTCLESLRHLHYLRRRIVVVDNGSTDGSVPALRRAERSDEIEIIESGRNLGYTGGNNLGIRHALDRGADFILVLNNDTKVDPMLLDELVQAAEEHPEAACFGPWLYYMDEPERLWWAGSRWSPEALAFSSPGTGRLPSELSGGTTSSDIVIGTALFFRASLPREIGLMDERFFLVYDESDWCSRTRRAGFQCVTVPTARVWHKVSPSFGGENSPMFSYFIARNKLLWAEKHVSRKDWWRIMRVALRRLFPVPGTHGDSGVSKPKALLWTAATYLRDWSRKIGDPHEVAHRRGVVDYLLRRFGDCPPKVRALTEAWKASKDPAATRNHRSLQMKG